MAGTQPWLSALRHLRLICPGNELQKVLTWNLLCSQRGQMIGQELAVNQDPVFIPGTLDQHGQGHFGSIALPAEHGLGKKHALKQNTVHTADQFTLPPYL